MKVRNIGIIAHIDAGKTTVTERFLFYSGKEHRMGEVHEGTAHMDWLQEEQERGITITSAATTFQWGDAWINLIDTPGHVDFTAEVERSLRVLDGAVGVFDGVAGVEAQSETVWRQADHYNVPRLAFVNKLDRVGADYLYVFEDLANRLHCVPLPMILPIGSEGSFAGIIDLLAMEEVVFDEASLGAIVERRPIAEERKEMAELWRGELLERVAEGSDEVMALYIEGEEVSADTLKKAIRAGTIARRWVPVFGGAAFRNKGVQPLLDAIVDYLPAPEDMVEVVGKVPGTEKEVRRRLAVEEPFCGLVFKVQVDQHGELHYLRAYSGRLERGATCLNVHNGKKERLLNIYRMHANQREALDAVQAGDIVALVGLRFSATGDTLCDPRHPIQLESPSFPETVISMAIEPRSAAERDKLLDQLARLVKEDPTFKLQVNEETGQIIISGMGELHLEVIRNRLIRDFKVAAKIGKPRVSYRQTFLGRGRRRVRFERLLGGKEHLGELDVEVLPVPEVRGAEIVWEEAGEIPRAWLPQIEDSVRSSISSGGDLGFPYVQIRVLLRSPGFAPEMTEIGLAMAAREAFEELEGSLETTVLEPVMRFQISTPEEYFGPIHQDLLRRRAAIERVETFHELRKLSGTVPLAEVFGYTTNLRSLSQGRASMTLEPVGYAPVPPALADKFRL